MTIIKHTASMISTVVLGAVVLTFPACDSGSSLANKGPGNQEQSSKVPLTQEIKTVSDFDHSEFCEQYHCKQNGSYASHNKDKTYTEYNYETSVDHLTVNVTAEGQIVAMCGLMFSERDRLSSDEFSIISTFLRSTDQRLKHDRALVFIKRNVEHPICSHCRIYDAAKFVLDGQFSIRAGKSMPDQVINFKRIGMLD